MQTSKVFELSIDLPKLQAITAACLLASAIAEPMATAQATSPQPAFSVSVTEPVDIIVAGAPLHMIISSLGRQLRASYRKQIGDRLMVLFVVGMLVGIMIGLCVPFLVVAVASRH